MVGLVRVVLLLGLAVKFWWLVLVALVVVAAACVGFWSCIQSDAAATRARRERAALVARADQQHAWVLAGDVRGVYGDYWPEFPSGQELRHAVPHAACMDGAAMGGPGAG